MIKKKNVSIVLSGGAVKGAFQVGVLKWIQEELINRDLAEIEVISGTSVGALNGSLMAQKSFDVLYDIWTKQIKSEKDIYKHWFPWFFPLSYATGYFKGGLYNSAPLRHLIEDNIDLDKLIASQIKFFSCSINLRSGHKTYIENIEENRDIIIDQILASASFPGAMPPVEIGGFKYLDGGIKEPVPAYITNKKTEKSDLIIIVLASRLEGEPIKIVDRKFLPLVMRTLDLTFEEVFQNDVRLGIDEHWDVKTDGTGNIINNPKSRFVIIQPPNIRFKHSFDAHPGRIFSAIEDGYYVGEKILKGYFPGTPVSF